MGKRDFEEIIQTELGLEPINRKDLITEYIDRRQFHFYLECKPSFAFHGEYNGYEIYVFGKLLGPVTDWSSQIGKGASLNLAVYIKSGSINFPKFLITNTNKFLSGFTGKFIVKGNKKAQRLFSRPHILHFFKQVRTFAAQGNGNEFIFFEINAPQTGYRSPINNAFNVLKLLSNVEIPPPFSEDATIIERYKRRRKWRKLFWGFCAIGAFVFVWFSV
jgi:hypothetical protein